MGVVDSVKGFFYFWYLQYTLNTSIYMLEPMEQLLFSILLTPILCKAWIPLSFGYLILGRIQSCTGRVFVCIHVFEVYFTLDSWFWLVFFSEFSLYCIKRLGRVCSNLVHIVLIHVQILHILHIISSPRSRQFQHNHHNELLLYLNYILDVFLVTVISISAYTFYVFVPAHVVQIYELVFGLRQVPETT